MKAPLETLAASQKVVSASDEESQYNAVNTNDVDFDESKKPRLAWYNTTKCVVVLVILLLISTALAVVSIALYSIESNKNDINCSDASSSNIPSSTTTIHPTISPSSSTTAQPTVNPATTSFPKNLIVVISDGMGQTYNTAYRTYKNLTKSTLDKYFIGRYSTTPTNEDGITDSAAGATVFAIGAKTHNSFIGLDGFGNPKGSILAAAKRQGKGTGLIAVKALTDATPAAFSSYSLYRGFYEHIAKQQATRQIDGQPMVDIMLGGGRKRFESWGFFDNTTMHNEYGWNTVTKDGAQFLSSLDDIDVDSLPFIGLFADDHYPYYLDRINGYLYEEDDGPYPGLVNMTKKGIDLLSTKYSNEGFFLMIEQSKVDWCGHDNDIVCLLWEMEEFTETMEYVIDWAQNDAQTLVVILSDHETGGMTIGRDGSFVDDGLVNYWNGKMPADGNVSQYWGSFLYDYNIPPPKSSNLTHYAVRKWWPQAIRESKHTAMWFADQIQLNESIQSVEDLYDTLESDYFGNGLGISDLEKEFVKDMFDRDSKTQRYSIAQLMSARTLTGWTTHDHTGADIAVHALGPNKDMFAGHWTNYEIGQLLSKAFGVESEQNEETQYVEGLFLNGELLICDVTKKPSSSKLPVEWNNSVEYPVGNLLYPNSKCVEQWI